jgi:hypothetical protein
MGVFDPAVKLESPYTLLAIFSKLFDKKTKQKNVRFSNFQKLTFAN